MCSPETIRRIERLEWQIEELVHEVDKMKDGLRNLEEEFEDFKTFCRRNIKCLIR